MEEERLQLGLEAQVWVSEEGGGSDPSKGEQKTMHEGRGAQ